MSSEFETSEQTILTSSAEFWHNYYESMRELHSRLGRGVTAPLKDRNQGTTDSKHIVVFEKLWRDELSSALGVAPSEVGPRQIKFTAHRSKKFDVCWPLVGDPKILISIKSMQNAYRNFTNRIEEAFGDSAVLRLYRSNASFGFFFFMLDGKVPRGHSEVGLKLKGDEKTGKGKGVAPHLEMIEEGGDFFSLDDVDTYRNPKPGKKRGRSDVIKLSELSLLDLASDGPKEVGGIHYDSIAYCPATISRNEPDPMGAQDWKVALSPIRDQLSYKKFIARLADVAKLRKLL
jgi:hypothetical protein